MFNFFKDTYDQGKLESLKQDIQNFIDNSDLDKIEKNLLKRDTLRSASTEEVERVFKNYEFLLRQIRTKSW